MDNDAYFSSLVADPEIARLLEEADEKEVPEISLSSLKKLVYQLEKRITENEEMRIQFPNKPDKFMESEIQLNIAIANMHQVCGQEDGPFNSSFNSPSSSCSLLFLISFRLQLLRSSFPPSSN